MAFPSTFLDLQRAVIAKTRLDADADLATGPDLQKAKDYINQAYAQVCVETETNVGLGTAVLTPNAATYQLPSQILRVRELLLQAAGATTYGPPLTETTLEQILVLRQGSNVTASTSGASQYAVVGINVLELWPTPAAADTLLFYYIGLPTALSAAGDIPVLQEPYGSKLIEYGALAEAADYLKDQDVDRYRTLYDMWMKKFRTHARRRQGGHVRTIPVGAQVVIPHDPSADVRVFA